jgi:hypothetical protein
VPDAAESLVAQQLVDTEAADGSLRVRLGHPLVGEVLHDAMPEPKRRRLLRALADEVDTRQDGRAPRELLRVVTWRLDAGVDEAPVRLAAAVALRLEDAGADPALISTATGIEIESVPALVELAHTKLNELLLAS